MIDEQETIVVEETEKKKSAVKWGKEGKEQRIDKKLTRT